MENGSNEYSISRISGVLISLAAIMVAAVVILSLTSTLLPSALDDAVGVLMASILIPVIALFKPLQTFVLFPEALGFATIFSKRIYKMLWTDVTGVRLKRSMFGIANLEFEEKDRMLYKKVPLTIMPKRGEFLIELMNVFPVDHPQRTLLEHLVQLYIQQDRSDA